MKKTHFLTKDGQDIACPLTIKAGTWTSDEPRRVTCLNCQDQPEYIEAVKAVKAAQDAEFAAQTPRTIVPQFGRVNADGVMECPWCSGVLWRERPRSLFSYHYVCEGCGKSVHPLTETGMCT